MAYTSVIPVYRLDNAVRYAQDKQKTTRQHGMPLAETVDYALNREKTETDGFESGLGCTTQSAYEDMRANAVRWHKTDGVQGYHLVQSFACLLYTSAKRMTAIEFLRRYRPNDLVKSSARGEFELRSHDSFKINGESSVWHWKSRGIGGKSALDYLIYVEEMCIRDSKAHCAL